MTIAHNPLTNKPDEILEPLYIIVPIMNQLRYWSRWELYYDFIRHWACVPNVRVVTVEVAFGERAFVVTNENIPQSSHVSHIQLRTSEELWLKENSINIAFSRLPANWKYAAWIDADITFARPDIIDATIHALQHYDIVQMFSQAQDLDPQSKVLAQYDSFASSFVKGEPLPTNILSYPYHGSGYKYGGKYWHSGYAWAIRRPAFSLIGGLLDTCVVGSADYIMAWAMLGKLLDGNKPIRDGFSPGYTQALLTWQRNALLLRKNIGCVDGLLLHHWHGKKSQRGYHSREQILVNEQFDPYNDLRKDWQGLWQLHDDGSERFVRLRDDIRAFFRARNEDSIDV